ncbi:MAG: recombinase family protein [Lachnospiraceae bacterium]|jgi:DNA invertase Pin-like site-specific DNA recombinase|nr:recombinase family protein [Lachnospiraceae bacterium]MCI9357200.1 recombinase family protein [Lachnospiraceae bacterium]
MSLTIQKEAALYVRVSTDKQDELSPDAQIRLGKEYCQKNDLHLRNEYIYQEHGISGRNADKRPQFLKMIADAKSPEHPFDTILVWKFSRFARNQEESIVYKSLLRKQCNVDVVSISEPLIDGPFGSLIERIIEWMDEYYSIRLSGEVIRGMTEKALREGYQTSPPLGYDAVGGGRPFIINEDQYRIVDAIFNMYDSQHLPPTTIARRLNQMGHRTRRGNLFEKRAVVLILRNPFYYGLVRWNGHEFIGNHETRLSKEQYDIRIQYMDSVFRPMGRHSVETCKHWLSGVVKCPICGASLSFNPAKKCPFFQCYNYAKGKHEQCISISEKKLVTGILESLSNILSTQEITYRYIPPKTEEADLSALYEKELERLSVKKNRIRQAYENGIDTLEEYRENKQRLEEEQENLESKLEELRASQDKKISDEQMLNKVQNVYGILSDPDIPYEVKGQALRSIVEKVIYDKAHKKLLVYYYFR